MNGKKLSKKISHRMISHIIKVLNISQHFLSLNKGIKMKNVNYLFHSFLSNSKNEIAQKKPTRSFYKNIVFILSRSQ
ncbi:hypothetical protein GCM10007855_20530 [Aliivibrio sifiae]|uniref:Uncharacterized protein n=1 Tax=Aliivibrio sifiae TaxID=566293 RepID=A0ABQ6AMJ7_9GAMM|nr:hypothetical protein GCM10007855_20530 [Aliivibrio sifiae]